MTNELLIKPMMEETLKLAGASSFLWALGGGLAALACLLHRTPSRASLRLVRAQWVPRAVAALFVLAFLPLQAMAQNAIAWDDLSPDEQAILAPMQNQWDTLQPRRQERLLRGADRWNSMTPEQRQQAQDRFQAWNSRTPEDRAEIRNRFEQFRGLPPGQQRDLRERFRRFQNLPEDQRRALRERFQNRPLGGRQVPPVPPPQRPVRPAPGR